MHVVHRLAVVAGLCAAFLASPAFAQDPPKSERGVSVDDVLALRTPKELSDFTNVRMEHLAALLKRAVDERSAKEVRPALERAYLEFQLAAVRITMMPELTDFERQRIAAQRDRFTRASAALHDEVKRVAGVPAIRKSLYSVMEPLYEQQRSHEQARNTSLRSTLLTVRSQIELYRLQHRDALPDFRTHGWDQLTRANDAAGVFLAAQASPNRYGPYLQNAPRNVLNGGTGILLVRGQPKPGFRHPDPQYGFVVDLESGRLWALDAGGQVFDESRAMATAE